MSDATDQEPSHGTQAAEPAAPTGRASGARRARWLAPAVVIVLLATAWATGLFDYLSLSSIIMHRASLEAFIAANLLPAAVVFVFAYAALVAVSFPGASFMTISGGLLFGGIPGSALSVIGATCGAVAIFLMARSSFGDFLQRRAGPFVARMVEGFQRDAFEYLLTIRLAPIFPFWVVNIVPALLNMKLRAYALATFVGIIPGSLAYSYIGAGLDSVIAAQEAANPGCAATGDCQIDAGALVTNEIVIALAALAIISILPLLVRRWRAKRLQ